MKINKVEVILVFVTMIQMLFWLHFFEGFTYAHEPNDFLDVTSFILLSIIGYVLTRIIFSDGSLRAKWIYGTFLFLVVLNIGFGFLNEYSNGYFETGLENLELNNINSKKKALLIDTKDYVIYGVNKTNNGEINISGEKIKGITKEETINILVELILPTDYYQYRNLLSREKKERQHMLIEFLEFSYPGKSFYVIDKKDVCTDFWSSADISCSFTINPSFKVRNIDPLFHELRTGKLKDRIGKYSKTIDELFSPIVVDTTYVNDPYFLIYRGEYKKAKENLKDLPLERRSFCEEKLRALGELD